MPPNVLLLFSLFTSCVAGIVRLTNGTYSYEGRVEVYSNGQWHNVCGYQWGFTTADVICKELGYSFALHPSDTDNFGQGSTSMLSIPVICEGSEKKLEECTFKYNELCPHSRDIGVVCSHEPLRAGSVRLDGTLSSKSYACGEVQVYLDERWGGICDKRDTWNEAAAEIACKQMGFDGHTYTSPTYVYKTKPVIGSLYCTGKESELLECHFDREISGCSHQSNFKVGVMACCYYKMFTFWFSVKLLSLLVVFVCVPIWVCMRSRWCEIVVNYLEKNANSSQSVTHRNQEVRPVTVDYVAQYTIMTLTRKRQIPIQSAT